MDLRGINYDIGTTTLAGSLTRKTFNVNTITRELTIIKNELHCNAVRICGLATERITGAAEIALKLGLTVLFSPYMPYGDQEDTLKYIVHASREAEKLRAHYPNIIFVLGCEFSLFTKGFVKGATGDERMKQLFSPFSLIKNLIGLNRTYNKKLNKFLLETLDAVRKEFHGQITYASGAWEKVDWQPFDFIGVDFYRSSFNNKTFIKELQHYKTMNKPLCIMEFGCCSYKGAAEKGAMGWSIADWKKDIPELNGDFIRDENVQACYLSELLDIFNGNGVMGAFVFTFVTYNYLYDYNPKNDMDMASFGIVKVMPDADQGYYQNLSWVPKKAFFELGSFYLSHQ